MEQRFPDHQIRMRYADADALVFGSLSGFRSYEAKGPSFIDLLLRVFEDEQSFQAKDFRSYPFELIIDYIRRTHRFYLHKILPEIEQNINFLLQDYAVSHPLLPILITFYNDYKKELMEHIQEEESELLPHIEYLMDINEKEIDLVDFYNKSNYTINDFIDHHHDSEEEITKVRNSILMYQPPTTNETPYRILLTQLQLFERDLTIHALIEDKVLIPRVQQLERRLNARFREEVRKN
jgi:regulator of cell morphogenesis and NO signaling